jgi:hypothetical protein
MTTPHDLPTWERICAWPETVAGKWSLLLDVGFVMALAVAFVLTRLGLGGGGTFFSNPWLAGMLLASAAAAEAGGLVALLAIVWRRERSFLMLVPLLFGGFVLLFVLGEIAGH